MLRRWSHAPCRRPAMPCSVEQSEISDVVGDLAQATLGRDQQVHIISQRELELPGAGAHFLDDALPAHLLDLQLQLAGGGVERR